MKYLLTFLLIPLISFGDMYAVKITPSSSLSISIPTITIKITNPNSVYSSFTSLYDEVWKIEGRCDNSPFYSTVKISNPPILGSLSLHDISVKLIGPIDNQFITIPDKKICITNVKELDEEMLRFLRIID